MFRRNLFSLVMLLALMLVPLGALAQDSEQEMETFTSEDGLLTFSYPAEWFVMSLSESEMSGPPFPFVIFSPSQETLDRLAMDEDFTEGEQAGAVVILPTEFFSVVGEVLLRSRPSVITPTSPRCSFLANPPKATWVARWLSLLRNQLRRLRVKWPSPPRKPQWANRPSASRKKSS